MDGAVHQWFGLTYASYLVLPRVLLSEMPAKWQERFVKMLDEVEAEFPGLMREEFNYMVRRRGQDGMFLDDPLSQYRHPDQRLIERMRHKPKEETT